jgi:hypothetical protein
MLILGVGSILGASLNTSLPLSLTTFLSFENDKVYVVTLVTILRVIATPLRNRDLPTIAKAVL